MQNVIVAHILYSPSIITIITKTVTTIYLFIYLF